MIQNTLPTKIVYTFVVILSLSFISACRDEPAPTPTQEDSIVGKWEQKVSSDSNDRMGVEFKSGGTGVLVMYEEGEDLYIGSIQYEATVLVTPTSETEKVIRITGSFIDGKITTYISISYITETKLIGKMSYFDGDPFEKDDWFSVNFDRVDKFSWE